MHQKLIASCGHIQQTHTCGSLDHSGKTGTGPSLFCAASLIILAGGSSVSGSICHPRVVRWFYLDRNRSQVVVVKLSIFVIFRFFQNAGPSLLQFHVYANQLRPPRTLVHGIGRIPEIHRIPTFRQAKCARNYALRIRLDIGFRGSSRHSSVYVCTVCMCMSCTGMYSCMYTCACIAICMPVTYVHVDVYSSMHRLKCACTRARGLG